MLVTLRVLKLLSVAAFGLGAVGAVMPGLPIEVRRIFAYRIAGPAFGATWMLGFTYAAVLSRPAFSAFVVCAMVGSMAAMHAALYAAGREGRDTAVTRALAVGGYAGAIVAMVVGH